MLMHLYSVLDLAQQAMHSYKLPNSKKSTRPRLWQPETRARDVSWLASRLCKEPSSEALQVSFPGLHL